MNRLQSGGYGVASLDLSRSWFPDGEYHDRVKRARALMKGASVDAMLLTSESNHVYFSGLQSPSFASRTRPITLVIPLESEPVMIVSKNQLPQAIASSWIADIRTHSGFERAALDVLRDAIKGMRLERASIGCELGEDQRIGMSPTGFRHLIDAFPRVAWVDAASILWSIRARKSDAEIQYLRSAGTAMGNAYEAMLGRVESGIRESDLYRTFLLALVAQGSERPGYCAMHSGAGHYGRLGPPTDRPLDDFDLLWMDAGAAFHGYWADYSRMISIGRPRPEHANIYRLVYEATREILATVRPGVPISRLMETCRSFFQAAGIELGSATRIGHGIGLDLTEPPSIVDDNMTQIEEGMTLAIEPAVARDDGYFSIEENFVVTSSGFNFLSEPAPEELPWA